MIEWLNDWMIEWLNDWMIEWLNDWMIEWLNALNNNNDLLVSVFTIISW